MFEVLDTNSAIVMVSVLGVKMPVGAFALGVLALGGIIVGVSFVIYQKLSQSKDSDKVVK